MHLLVVWSLSYVHYKPQTGGNQRTYSHIRLYSKLRPCVLRLQLVKCKIFWNCSLEKSRWRFKEFDNFSTGGSGAYQEYRCNNCWVNTIWWLNLASNWSFSRTKYASIRHAMKISLAKKEKFWNRIAVRATGPRQAPAISRKLCGNHPRSLISTPPCFKVPYYTKIQIFIFHCGLQPSSFAWLIIQQILLISGKRQV